MNPITDRSSLEASPRSASTAARARLTLCASLLVLGLACESGPKPEVTPTAPAADVGAGLDGFGREDAHQPSDLGADAQAPDASAGEADAAAPDAVPRDAQPDAAQPDAAQPDAAQPDAAQPDAAQPDAAQPPLEDCTNGDDDDGDALIDCADPDCGPEPACALGPAFSEAELEARFTTDCSRCHPFLIEEFLSRTHNRQVAGMPIVTPGDHRRSYLWYKLAGTQLRIGGLGQTMPIGAPWNGDDVARFALWINDLPSAN